jgi:hypothetical protein
VSLPRPEPVEGRGAAGHLSNQLFFSFRASPSPRVFDSTYVFPAFLRDFAGIAIPAPSAFSKLQKLIHAYHWFAPAVIAPLCARNYGVG